MILIVVCVPATGGSSGIGKATAKALASMGARVIIASSNTFKCIAAVQEIQGLWGGGERNVHIDLYIMKGRNETVTWVIF